MKFTINSPEMKPAKSARSILDQAVRAGREEIILDEFSDEILRFAFDNNDGERFQFAHAVVTNPKTGRLITGILQWEYDRENGIEGIRFTVTRK